MQSIEKVLLSVVSMLAGRNWVGGHARDVLMLVCILLCPTEPNDESGANVDASVSILCEYSCSLLGDQV